MVSAGSVIGSGWLLGTLNASEVAGPAAIISWIIGAVLLIGIALVYAELGATYPISGGTARFTWIHAGTLGGFFCGTFSYLQAVAIAPIEVEAIARVPEREMVAWPAELPSLLTGKGLVVGSGVMFVFTAVNLLGVKWMAEGNTVMMMWKILVPVATVILIMSKAFHTSNFTAGGGLHAVRHQGRVRGAAARRHLRPGRLRAGGPDRRRGPQPEAGHPAGRGGVDARGRRPVPAPCRSASSARSTRTNVLHGWANPFGDAGAFGPYYTLATSVGLGWLGVILIIDALISPGGTGLVYLATTSRLSYSLARVRFLPPVFSSIDRRGVPWFSIVFGGAFGCLLFLPFGGWAKLVGAITAASSFMYSYAPVAAVSLRKSDPDRPRPYKVPRAEHHRPVQLRGVRPDHLLERDLERGQAGPGGDPVLPGPVLRRPQGRPGAGADRLQGRGLLAAVDHRPDDLLDLRRQLRRWLPQVFGIAINHHLPFWWDIGAVAVFSLVVFYYAIHSRLGPERVSATGAEAIADAHQEDLDLGVRGLSSIEGRRRQAAMTVETAAAELLGLFPPGSRVDADGELVVAGCRLADLADTWDTPLYVVDETAVRAQVRRVRQALEDRWQNSRMVFASKAFPCTADVPADGRRGHRRGRGRGGRAGHGAGRRGRPGAGSWCTATPRPRPSSGSRWRPGSA